MHDSDALDQLGHARARPRPLPVVRERILVDRDDDRGSRGALEGEQALVAVEYRIAQPGRARREGDGEERERRGEQQGEDAQAPQCAQRSISRPS
jgi:hypothetical protein